jgi:hypothetical protein
MEFGKAMKAICARQSSPTSKPRWIQAGVVLAIWVAGLGLGGCALAPNQGSTNGSAQFAADSVEATFGIKVEGLRRSAAGSMLDFRYRVLDPQKAAPLLDGKLKPFLLDAKRDAKLGVPNTPVLGSIRQTARNKSISTDHTYFIIFGNPGKAVESGDTVTLLIGQVKITDLVVR